MNKIIKTNNKKEILYLNKLFKAVPKHLKPWDELLKIITENKDYLFAVNEDMIMANIHFSDTLTNLNNDKTDVLDQIKEIYKENIDFIHEDFKKSQKTNKELFLTEQAHIKNQISKINSAHKRLASSLDKNIKTLNEEHLKELDVLNSELKESKEHYLNKVSSIYLFKESEEIRINNKFNDQTEDYNQKNKQRLLQNTLRLQEESKKLKEYQEFHEKDAIYSKQNYFKAITNLNNKINFVSSSYKEIEKNLEAEFIAENEKLIKNLDDEKKRLSLLADEALNLYEKKYQEIDAILDKLRENHHNQESKLKNKYNRDVTTININLHNKKEAINVSLKELPIENKKEIRNLEKELKTLEKNSKKDIKNAYIEYKKAYINEIKQYVTSYESTLFDRTIAEQNKNDALELYKELYSLYEDFIHEKTRLYKEKNNLKKTIVEHYKQQELIPLESQIDLASHLYNLEISLQKLDDDYTYLTSLKEKELINLKSSLHEYNLNKTKDKIIYNHELELTISNLTNYLQMESEKNEFVFENDLSTFKKRYQESVTEGEILKVNQQQQLSTLQEKQKTTSFNFILETKMEIKNLNDSLLKELNSYNLKKEQCLKSHQINKLNYENFLEQTIKEGEFLDELLSLYRSFYLSILEEEKALLDVFFESSTENTNIDDYEVFLETTKELLLLKHSTTESLINNFFTFSKEYFNLKITTYSESKLELYKEKVIETYDTPLQKLINEQTKLNDKLKSNSNIIVILTKDIKFLSTKREFSLKSLEENQKHLVLLNKKEKTEENTLIIAELIEQIEVNNNIIVETTNKLNQINEEINSLKEKNVSIRLSLKAINLNIKSLAKDKKESLGKATSIIQSGTKVFWQVLNKFDVLNEEITKVNNDFSKTITSISFSQPLNETKKLLSFSLNNKDKIIKQSFKTVLKIKKDKLALTIKQQNQTRDKEIAEENQELLKLKNEHENNCDNINSAIKKTEYSSNLTLNKLSIKDKKEISKLNNEHLIKQNENILLQQQIKEEINQFKYNYKQLKKAFEVNKSELLTKEKETHKNHLKASLKHNQKLIKETNDHIKKIDAEIELETKKYTSQQTFSAHKDKVERKKILDKQTNIINYHEKQILRLKQDLPKIDVEVNVFLARKELNESRFKKKRKLQSFFVKHKNKFYLRSLINEQRKQLKRKFLSENQN